MTSSERCTIKNEQRMNNSKGHLYQLIKINRTLTSQVDLLMKVQAVTIALGKACNLCLLVANVTKTSLTVCKSHPKMKSHSGPNSSKTKTKRAQHQLALLLGVQDRLAVLRQWHSEYSEVRRLLNRPKMQDQLQKIHLQQKCMMVKRDHHLTLQC